ncbi:hypothetical protein CLOM_g23870 [Closterium sp. NIES-68]|nr:hypothetical protein CLOM_g14701 [Closterium sp. NIES-68]GJP39506.1 hypothetical protein CLOM_g23870 [Closterium sp. NIES-68]
MDRRLDSTPSLKGWADPMFSAPPATPSPKEAGAQKRLRTRDLPGSPCASLARRAASSPMRNAKRAQESASSGGAKRMPTLRVLRHNSLPAPSAIDLPAALELPAPAIPTFSTPSPYHAATFESQRPRHVRRCSVSRCAMPSDAALDALDSFLLPPPALPLSAFVPPSPPLSAYRATPVTTRTGGEEREQTGACVKDTPAATRRSLLDLGTNQRTTHSPRKSDPMFEIRQRSSCLSPTARTTGNVTLAGCSTATSGAPVATWQLPRRVNGSRMCSPIRAPRRMVLLSSAT